LPITSARCWIEYGFGERDDAEGLFSGHEARVVAGVESGAARREAAER